MNEENSKLFDLIKKCNFDKGDEIVVDMDGVKYWFVKFDLAGKFRYVFKNETRDYKCQAIEKSLFKNLRIENREDIVFKEARSANPKDWKPMTTGDRIMFPGHYSPNYLVGMGLEGELLILDKVNKTTYAYIDESGDKGRVGFGYIKKRVRITLKK